MKLSVVLFLIFGLVITACSTQDPVVPTPIIGATVEAEPRKDKVLQSTMVPKQIGTAVPIVSARSRPTQKTLQAPKESSKSDSSDFGGINIFSLPFADFPFSCAEFGKPEFTSAFFPPDLITAIIPMGKMAAHGSKHVTPTDHLYIHREFSAGDEYVLAPSDGSIVKIERFPNDLPLNQADESGKWLGDSGGPMVPD